MIIGVSGRIGSGKDSIGKIIMCLSAGYKQEEIVKVVKEEGDYALLPFSDEGEWDIKKFAGKLKLIASIILGVPVEKFEDQEFKKTFLGKEWNYMYKLPRLSLDQDHIVWEERQMTVREFLQKLGTEAIRDGIHTNAWVNALFADYSIFDDNSGTKSFNYPNWVVTDTRFPNEAQAIKERGGIVVRVTRELPDVDYKTLEQTLHPSETSLDNWEFDERIENNGTIEELIEKVKALMGKYNLLSENKAQVIPNNQPSEGRVVAMYKSGKHRG